ncbi:MAG: flavin reductase [Myxococcales bacterium]|nr:flavin reductase [Myxococcales bacterium]
MSNPTKDKDKAAHPRVLAPAPVSGAAFREALARFASGVTIVAAYDGSTAVGFTATGFTSVSLLPPLILVCVGRATRVHDPVVSAAYFSVNILDERQSWLASRFAQPGIDRFCGVSLRVETEDRAPLIDNALANLQCRHQVDHEAGDHTILVGEVVDACVAPGTPLLHFARRFGAFVQQRPRPR